MTATSPPPGPGGAASVPQPPRRPSRWVLAVVVVALLAAAAVVVFVLTRGSEPDPEPTATTTTTASAEPTPEPTPDTRTVSTDPLIDRLGTEVVDPENPAYRFTLAAGWTSDEPAVAAGAREAVTGTWTDGTTELPVTAAAFDAIAAQDDHAATLVAALEEEGATALSEGSVYADETGRYWSYLLPDGETATVVWRTDDGVVLTLTGPIATAQEVYSLMPL